MNVTVVNRTVLLHLETERTPLRWFMITVDVYLATGLILFGFIGNSVSFLVLRRDRFMRRATRLLLQVLAITDFSYLVCCILYQPMFAIAFDPKWGKAFLDKYLPLEPYVSPLVSITQMAGSWIVVLVALDRYMAICHPLRAKTVCTTNRIRAAIISIWIFAALFNAPRFTGAEIPHTIDQRTGGVILKIPLEGDWQYHPLYNLIYQVILVFLFRMFVPLVALTFLNVKLIQAVRSTASHSSRALTPSNAMEEKSLRSTLMLIIVVSIFMVCMIPTIYGRIFWLSRIMKSGVPKEEIQKTAYDDKLMYIYSCAKLFMTINASINFIVYFVVGRRFRRNFLRMLYHCCRRNRTTVLVAVKNNITLSSMG